MYNYQNMFEYMNKQSQLSQEQKATIFKSVLNASFSSFKFILEKGTSMTEQQIMNAIILYHKVQHGSDKEFAKNAKQFLENINSNA